MKKKLMKSIILGLSVSLIIPSFGCSKSLSNRILMDIQFIETYAIEIVQVEEEMNAPRGLTMIGDHLLVVDSGNNRLLKIDQAGKVLSIIGKTGYGEGELFHPVAVAVDEEQNIYVADSGNGRVQKLNKAGDFIDQWKLDDFSNHSLANSMIDIEVDSERNIYVSALSLNSKVNKVHIIDSKGRVTKIGKKIVGSLAKVNDQIFFVSQLEVKAKDVIGSGRNFLYKLIDEKLVELSELPYAYSSAGLVSYKDEFFMFSRAFQTLDRYSSDGNYLNTVWHEEDFGLSSKTDFSSGMYAMTINHAGDIYITNYLENKLYRFRLKE